MSEDVNGCKLDQHTIIVTDSDIIWIDFEETLIKAGLAPARNQKVDWLKWALTFFILEPIINRDLRLRAAGKRPDRMHWADALAIHWTGFSMVQYWEQAA